MSKHPLPVPIHGRIADTAISASVASTASNACTDCIANTDIIAITRHPRRRSTRDPTQPRTARSTSHSPPPTNSIPPSPKNLP